MVVPNALVVQLGRIQIPGHLSALIAQLESILLVHQALVRIVMPVGTVTKAVLHRHNINALPDTHVQLVALAVEPFHAPQGGTR
jgi:hypothetical protein